MDIPKCNSFLNFLTLFLIRVHQHTETSVGMWNMLKSKQKYLLLAFIKTKCY